MNVPTTVPRMLFTLRVIVAALVFGVVASLALAVVVMRPTPDPGTATLLLTVLALFAVGEVVAYAVLRRIWNAQLRRRVSGETAEESEPALVNGFFTQTLIGAALTEGASLFAAIIYLVTASRPALLAAGLGILLLLVQLPTADRYRTFVERLSGRRPA